MSSACPVGPASGQLEALLDIANRQIAICNGRDWPQQHVHTSSVSYVVASESTQAGTRGAYQPLPHVTIRPPGLQYRPAEAAALCDVVVNQGTAVAVMPWRSDHAVRSYLLHPARRRAALAAQGGCLRGGQVLGSIRRDLRDRTFVVLHYFWDGERLWPCTTTRSEPPAVATTARACATASFDAASHPAPPASHPPHTAGAFEAPALAQAPPAAEAPAACAVSGGGVAAPSAAAAEGQRPTRAAGSITGAAAERGVGAAGKAGAGGEQLLGAGSVERRGRTAGAAEEALDPEATLAAERVPRCYTIEDSNVQVGLLVRKGVGGTYPFQAAQRALEAAGVLPLQSQLGPVLPPAPPGLRTPPPTVTRQRANTQAASAAVPSTAHGAAGTGALVAQAEVLCAGSAVAMATATSLAAAAVAADAGLGAEPGTSAGIVNPRPAAAVTPAVAAVPESVKEVTATTAMAVDTQLDKVTPAGLGAVDAAERAPQDRAAALYTNAAAGDKNVARHAAGTGGTADASLDVSRGAGAPPAAQAPFLTAAGTASIPPHQLPSCVTSQLAPGSLSPALAAASEIRTTTSPTAVAAPASSAAAMSHSGIHGTSAGGGGVTGGGATERAPGGKPLKLYAQCCRLELYVDEQMWRRTTRSTRDLLYSAVRDVETRLHALLCEWNHEALRAHCESLLQYVRSSRGGAKSGSGRGGEVVNSGGGGSLPAAVGAEGAAGAADRLMRSLGLLLQPQRQVPEPTATLAKQIAQGPPQPTAQSQALQLALAAQQAAGTAAAAQRMVQVQSALAELARRGAAGAASGGASAGASGGAAPLVAALLVMAARAQAAQRSSTSPAQCGSRPAAPAAAQATASSATAVAAAPLPRETGAACGGGAVSWLLPPGSGAPTGCGGTPAVGATAPAVPAALTAGQLAGVASLNVRPGLTACPGAAGGLVTGAAAGRGGEPQPRVPASPAGGSGGTGATPSLECAAPLAPATPSHAAVARQCPCRTQPPEEAEVPPPLQPPPLTPPPPPEQQHQQQQQQQGQGQQQQQQIEMAAQPLWVTTPASGGAVLSGVPMATPLAAGEGSAAARAVGAVCVGTQAAPPDREGTGAAEVSPAVEHVAEACGVPPLRCEGPDVAPATSPCVSTQASLKFTPQAQRTPAAPPPAQPPTPSQSPHKPPHPQQQHQRGQSRSLIAAAATIGGATAAGAQCGESAPQCVAGPSLPAGPAQTDASGPRAATPANPAEHHTAGASALSIPGGVPALLVITAACSALVAEIAAGRGQAVGTAAATPLMTSAATTAASPCLTAVAATPAATAATAAAATVMTSATAAAVTAAAAAVAPSGFPWPLYLVGTRDSFTYHLVPRTTFVHAPDGRTFKRTEFFFREDELPPDYWCYAGKPTTEVFQAQPSEAAQGPCGACRAEGATAPASAAAGAYAPAPVAACVPGSGASATVEKQRSAQAGTPPEEARGACAVAAAATSRVSTAASGSTTALPGTFGPSGRQGPSTAGGAASGRLTDGSSAGVVGRGRGSADGHGYDDQATLAAVGEALGSILDAMCADTHRSGCASGGGREGSGNSSDGAATAAATAGGDPGAATAAPTASSPSVGGATDGAGALVAETPAGCSSPSPTAAAGDGGGTKTGDVSCCPGPATSSVHLTSPPESPRAASASATVAAPLLPAPGPPPPGLLPVGVVTYTELFSGEELGRLEAEADGTDAAARAGLLPPDCQHSTYGKGGGGVGPVGYGGGEGDGGGGGCGGGGTLKRTKLFFGARYLWTRDQLASPGARIAGGVRVDVPPPLRWMRHLAESPLVRCGVIPPGFVDSVALNLYHDGSEGIQSHFDDAARFRRPIYSVRLFSDSRLSFGGSLYGTTNNAFFVPMPRGCVTVMEDASFAANGIKHCVRPVDMAGKSAALILRGIEPAAMRRAQELLLEETCAQLVRALHIVEGPTGPERPLHPQLASAAPTHLNAAAAAKGEGADTTIARVVRCCLDRMVGCVAASAQRQEAAAARLRAAGTKAAVAAVVRRMVWRVTRCVARQQCGLDAADSRRPRAAAAAAQARSSGAAAGGRGGPFTPLHKRPRAPRGLPRDDGTPRHIALAVRQAMARMLRRLEEAEPSQAHPPPAASAATSCAVTVASRARQRPAGPMFAPSRCLLGKRHREPQPAPAPAASSPHHSPQPHPPQGALRQGPQLQGTKRQHCVETCGDSRSSVFAGAPGAGAESLQMSLTPALATPARPPVLREAASDAPPAVASGPSAADQPERPAAWVHVDPRDLDGSTEDTAGEGKASTCPAGGGGGAATAAAAAAADAGKRSLSGQRLPCPPSSGPHALPEPGRCGAASGHEQECQQQHQQPSAKRRRGRPHKHTEPGGGRMPPDLSRSAEAAQLEQRAGASEAVAGGGAAAATAAAAADDDEAVAADGAVDPALIEEQWSGRWREARVLRAATRLAVAGAELGGPELRRAVREVLRLDGFRMLRWLRRHREAVLAAADAAGASPDGSHQPRPPTPGPPPWAACITPYSSYTDLMLSAVFDEADPGRETPRDGELREQNSLAGDNGDGTNASGPAWGTASTVNSSSSSSGGANCVRSVGPGQCSVLAADSFDSSALWMATPMAELLTEPRPMGRNSALSAQGCAAQSTGPPPPGPCQRSTDHGSTGAEACVPAGSSGGSTTGVVATSAPVGTAGRKGGGDAFPAGDTSPGADVPRLWRRLYDRAVKGAAAAAATATAAAQRDPTSSSASPAAPVPARCNEDGGGAAWAGTNQGNVVAAAEDGAVAPGDPLREVSPAQLLAHAALSYAVTAAAEAAAEAMMARATAKGEAPPLPSAPPSEAPAAPMPAAAMPLSPRAPGSSASPSGCGRGSKPEYPSAGVVSPVPGDARLESRAVCGAALDADGSAAAAVDAPQAAPAASASPRSAPTCKHADTGLLPPAPSEAVPAPGRPAVTASAIPAVVPATTGDMASATAASSGGGPPTAATASGVAAAMLTGAARAPVGGVCEEEAAAGAATTRRRSGDAWSDCEGRLQSRRAARSGHDEPCCEMKWAAGRIDVASAGASGASGGARNGPASAASAASAACGAVRVGQSGTSVQTSGSQSAQLASVGTAPPATASAAAASARGAGGKEAATSATRLFIPSGSAAGTGEAGARTGTETAAAAALGAGCLAAAPARGAPDGSAVTDGAAAAPPARPAPLSAGFAASQPTEAVGASGTSGVLGTAAPKPAGLAASGLHTPQPAAQPSHAPAPLTCVEALPAAPPEGARRTAAGAGPGAGAGPKRKQRAVSSLPLLVCMSCYEALPADVDSRGMAAGGTHWVCEGPCLRSFHTACASPVKPEKYEQARCICEDCFRDSHPCAICGHAAADIGATAAAAASSAGGLVKCGQASCGRWYHAECAASHSFTKPLGSGGGAAAAAGRGRGRSGGGSGSRTLAAPLAPRKFRCPLHTCAVCTGGGEGAAMMACVACATGYHAKCRPEAAELLSRKLLLCPLCCAAKSRRQG